MMSIRWSSLYLFWWAAYKCWAEIEYVLVYTVGSAGPPVSCLGAWCSTVNNDAISRLQICSPRCWIYCAEPAILTAHWNWVGNWSANSSSEHIPIGASKTSVFLARTQLDWKLQTLIEVCTNFTPIVPSVVSYVDSWTTEITGPELLVITRS